MKLFLKICLLAVPPLLLISCASQKNPPATVSSFDKTRYAGEWHEIARLPNRFEKDVVAAKATYGINPDGSVSVLNEGMKSDGTMTKIRGTARPNSSGKAGQLKVRFDEFPANLFAGDYWVLKVNDSYTRALVASPDKKFLWLLSKDPDDKAPDFTSYIAHAEAQGFNTGGLFFNPHRITE
ncbi:lipocalin family protein [Luteolibacter algae]|uniref:Lipocalin family protein n=1 Tax=Luteolibacter algae TaxID=454151 RepID=A0ABW5D983_9BACT